MFRHPPICRGRPSRAKSAAGHRDHGFTVHGRDVKTRSTLTRDRQAAWLTTGHAPMKPTTKLTRGLVLCGWMALVALLAAGAYTGGALLAPRWTVPSLALPEDTPTPRLQPALWIAPGEPEEGNLEAQGPDEWRFRGELGQSATIEMWFHPGAGSSIDAELLVRLRTPDGAVLAEEQGSLFLPPYLFEPALPVSGIYEVEVSPIGGAPGRYSLGLTLSEPTAEAPPRSTPVAPPRPPEDSPAAAATIRFDWPTRRRDISGWTFHDPGNPAHIGLDIAARSGDPIVAVTDGSVVYADWAGGYGNLVIVEHANDWRSYYAHLQDIAVRVGEQVWRGESLGRAGSTGNSTGPHLHFELRYGDRPVDPHIYLP